MHIRQSSVFRASTIVPGLLFGLGMFVLCGTAQADHLILRNLVLIDGTGSPPRPVAEMVIEDGRIAAILEAKGDLPTRHPGQKFVVLDLDGLFVMPGLIDTHVHLANFPRGHDYLARRLEWAVRGGVTTVRDLGGDARALGEARRAIQAGELIGPNLRYSAIVGAPSLFGHPAMLQAARGFEPGQAPWQRAVSAGADLPRLVAEARGAGVDALKIYGDLEADTVRALIGAAAEQGLLAWAHATVFPTRPSELVEAGASSLSHAPYLVWEAVGQVPADYRARTQAPYSDYPPNHADILVLLDQMAARGVVLDATLAMFRDMTKYRPAAGIEWAMEAFEWGVAVTRLAHARGVPVAVGTDAFFPPSEYDLPNTHVELQTLVEDVGMTPLEAITAATLNGAKAAGMDRERGTLQTGMAADLIILKHNPAEDITATRSIRDVVINGRLVE